MELDPIEIRLGNYFEYRKTVREITLPDLGQLETLMSELKPIPIKALYLAKLNFTSITNTESVRHYQKYAAGIYFNIFPKRDGSMALYINNELKLPHIQAIHQLQNVYYDLTGDILKRIPPSPIHYPVLQNEIKPIKWERKSGPGKYRK